MSITPKNWATFQHYKDRKPAWIKLHHDLLDDYEFFRLPVASRALAPCLWLLASEYSEGEITATLEEIAFRLRMPHAELCEAIHPLIEAGFFILSKDVAVCYQSASKPLAEPEQVAIPEKEREIEKEEDTGASRRAADYVFESGIIRLNAKDFEKWREAYSHLDLRAELLSLSEWASNQGAKWFHAVQGALAKRNREQRARQQGPPPAKQPDFYDPKIRYR